MTKEEYILLYEKCVAGNCTEQERKILSEYKDDFSFQNSSWDKDALGDKKELVAGMYKTLRQAIQAKKRNRRRYRYSMAAAAVISFIIVCFGFYFYLGEPPSLNGQPDTENITLKQDLPPGSNKAVLTLADGSRINLDQAKNGMLVNQGNISINKTKDGQIVYTPGARTPAPTADVLMNRIATPRGGQYELMLPDGTKVWLNAASSLRYPARFNGSERKVELTGEAYFEVAENKKMPFRVAVNDMVLEVLGTHFNVMSYKDEHAIETTLLEGSVKVTNNQSEKMLAPGQKAVLNRAGGTIQVFKADLEAAVAWKNGYFMFNNEDVYTAMRKISRWYNVEISFEGDLKGKRFGGTVSKFENVSEVLKTMELAGVVHFKWKEGRILVMP